MATNQDIYAKLDILRRELSEDAQKLEDKIDRTYLRLAEYERDMLPLRKIVYGLVGVILAGFITAMLALVLK